MADYTLSAKITGDSSNYQKAVEKAQKTTDSFQKSMDKVSGGFKKFGSTLTSAGKTLTVGLTIPIAAAGKAMIDAASDFDENLNKVDVAFGDSAGEVKAWADTALESFGLAQNQALEATSLFGDMATSMGISQEEASKMATSLAGLAGDLASFKNVGIDQAMTALNGVFTGETESLKQLGVVMTEINLKEFASGLGLVYDEMTQAEKVQLRYNYVLEMTKNAQGDYARTSDGAANSMRTFQGTLNNLAIVLGQQVLPIFTPLVQKATELAQKFAEMNPETQQLILKIMLAAAVIGPLLIILGSLFSAIGNIITGVKLLGTAFTFLASPIGIAILAIGSLIAAGVMLYQHWEEVRAIAASVWSSIQSIFQDFDSYLTGVFTTDWTTSFGSLGEVMNAFAKTSGDIWNSIKQIFNGMISFITGVFTGNWSRAWQGVVDTLGGIFSGIVNVVKAPINGVIGLINSAIHAINGISVSIPDWVPLVGGKTFGVNLPSIPYLLHGTRNWQGGLAYMNEGGRGELVNLPNGSQVIPHDISVKYAKEAAQRNTERGYIDVDALGQYIVSAMIEYGNRQKEGLEKGIGRMGVYLNNRQTGRVLEDMGFVRG